MKFMLILTALVLLPVGVFAQPPSNSDIHAILKNRLWRDDLGIGIVVGVIDSGGRRVISFGSVAKTTSVR